MSIEDLQKILETAFPNGKVQILDPQNDGVHLGAVITCDSFAGKNRVARHRLVYNALGNAFDGPLHALQMTTQTFEEAAQASLS